MVQTDGEMETSETPPSGTPAGDAPARDTQVRDTEAVGPLVGAQLAGETGVGAQLGGGVAVSPLDDPSAPEASVEAVDRLLDEVEHALSRLDDGTYGQCSMCGDPIDDSRLANEPTVRECANCQVPAVD